MSAENRAAKLEADDALSKWMTESGDAFIVKLNDNLHDHAQRGTLQRGMTTLAEAGSSVTVATIEGAGAGASMLGSVLASLWSLGSGAAPGGAADESTVSEVTGGVKGEGTSTAMGRAEIPHTPPRAAGAEGGAAEDELNAEEELVVIAMDE